jgi:PKD repeat protein
MNNKLIPVVLIITLLSTSIPALTVSSAPDIQLPTGYVTMYAQYGAESWFEMTLSGIPAGYDVENGQYLGWCIQKSVTMTKYVNHTVALYSSYDPNMPEQFHNCPWNKINYVINHKQGSRESIEKVLWYYAGEDVYPETDLDAQHMIINANANGTSFIPDVGQNIAILVEGIQTIQRTFFELPILAPQAPETPQYHPPRNHAPTADGTAGEPYHGFVGEALSFDGSRSYDRDGSITSYAWSFGDETSASGAVVSHIYTTEGSYEVHLTVRDDQGASDTYTTTAVIILSNYPPSDPIVYGTMSGHKNTAYDYTAVSTDPDGNDLTYVFDWGTGETTTTGVVPSETTIVQSYTWTSAGMYIVSVKASDSQTESGATTLIVLIDAVFTGDLGYMIDNDGDGIYDTFYSNTTGSITSMGTQSGGSEYLLDVNGDGTFDYQYNAAAGSVTAYQGELWSAKTLIFITLVVVIIIFLLVAVVKVKQRTRRGTNGGTT